MPRRTIIKWLHWLSFGLILYFFLIEPEENIRNPGLALSTHAGMGLLLAAVSASWLALYLSKGLAGRPGPKLSSPAKSFHSFSHLALQTGLPLVVLTGALAGLAAPFAIKAFGLLQLNPAFRVRGVHKLAKELHEIAFDALAIIIIAHALFHIWRHLRLHDNALRIMFPKFLHKYL